jgi:SNF2 family DNA or RNA helicase
MYVNLEKTYIYLEKTINSIKENDIESCPICLDDMNEIAITSCGHKFCWKCIEDYSKLNTIKKCPCCKAVFTSKDVYLVKKSKLVSNNTNENEELREMINNTKSTKIGNIIYWLKQTLLNNNSTETDRIKIPKIIVFSQWDEILNKVSDCLSDYDINVVHCKGSVYQKKKSIELFMSSDKYNIIMLSSRNAASGINLTVANEIVLIEPVYGNNEYRKNIENQAIGRCVRIGNTQNINVNRFIINNTIESDIYNGMIDDTKLKIMPQNT